CWCVKAEMGLPASLRASLADAMDWSLLAILAFSLLVHFGGVAWLRAMDWPRHVETEVMPMAPPPPIVQVRIAPPPTAPAATPAVLGPSRGAATARHRVRLAPEKARAAVRELLGSIGQGGHLEDRVDHARGDLDRELEGASAISDGPGALPLPS